MTQEDKELLIKDLCARLPYGVKLDTPDGLDTLGNIDTNEGWINASYDVDEVKPYLRPMSSFTDEEYDQLYIDSRVKEDTDDILDALANDMDAIDWLNAHHFDYRGLIERGLALEAPKDMYK